MFPTGLSAPFWTSYSMPDRLSSIMPKIFSGSRPHPDSLLQIFMLRIRHDICWKLYFFYGKIQIKNSHKILLSPQDLLNASTSAIDWNQIQFSPTIGYKISYPQDTTHGCIKPQVQFTHCAVNNILNQFCLLPNTTDCHSKYQLWWYILKATLVW